MMLTYVIDNYLAKQRSLGMRFESAEVLLRRFCRVMGNREISEITPRRSPSFSRQWFAQCHMDAALQGPERILSLRRQPRLCGVLATADIIA